MLKKHFRKYILFLFFCKCSVGPVCCTAYLDASPALKWVTIRVLWQSGVFEWKKGENYISHDWQLQSGDVDWLSFLTCILLWTLRLECDRKVRNVEINFRRCGVSVQWFHGVEHQVVLYSPMTGTKAEASMLPTSRWMMLLLSLSTSWSGPN